MSLNNRFKINQRFDTGLPEINGDRFRPADYIADKFAEQGYFGDYLAYLYKHQSIISGLVVSKGTGDTLDITAGEALVYRDASTIQGHNYDGSQLGFTTPVAKFPILLVGDAENDLAIGDAVLDGKTLNYVKAIFDEADGYDRNPTVLPLTTYSYLTQFKITYEVDDTAPTTDQVLLCTFRGTAGGSFTFYTTERTQTLANYEPHKIVTNYTGHKSRLYLTSGHASRKGSVYQRTTELTDSAGLRLAVTDIEQANPVRRVDKSATVDGTPVTVPTGLSETAGNYFTFSPSTTIIGAENVARFGIYIKTVGTGYTNVVLTLHDDNDVELDTVNISEANISTVGANAWIYVDMANTLLPGATYHVHFHVAAGTAPTIGNNGTSPMFREMYLPTAGNYDGGTNVDCITIKNSAGTVFIPARGVNDDNITTPGTGYNCGTAIDIMAVDFSNTTTWTSWEYNNYIGVDVRTGRLKFPSGYDVTNYYANYNTAEITGDFDAKSVLRHENAESVEDFFNRVFPNGNLYIDGDAEITGTSEFGTGGAITTYTNIPESSFDVSFGTNDRIGGLAYDGANLVYVTYDVDNVNKPKVYLQTGISATNNTSFEIGETTDYVIGMCYGGGKLFVIMSITTDIDIYDGVSSTLLSTITPDYQPGGLCVSIAHDGTNLISIATDEKVYIHDGITGTTTSNFVSPCTAVNLGTSIAYDGTNLIIRSGTDKKVFVMSGITDTVLYSFHLDDAGGSEITFGGGNIVYLQYVSTTTIDVLENQVRNVTDTHEVSSDAVFSGDVQIDGALVRKVVTVNYTPFTPMLSAAIILVDSSSEAITVNLPLAADSEGRTFTIKSTGINAVTIDGSGSETIDGALTYVLSQYESVDLVCDGSNWYII